MGKTEKKVINVCPECKVPGSDGKMPIVGFNSPIRSWHSSERGFQQDFTSNDFIQERYCQLISECGINLITHFENDYADYPEDFHKILAWAEKYDFNVFVNDNALLREDMTDEEFEERISEYSKYKSFAGIKIVDEPCNEHFPAEFNGEQKLSFHPMKWYSALSRRLNSYDNLIGYINLLPYYWWMECTMKEYRGYIEEFLESCEPKVISYDHYPFDDKNRKRAMEWFFENLAVIREYSQKAGIPFWAYVQCGSQWNATGKSVETQTYRPTKYEFFWNVNVLLAYGCKGIEYYPLVQPYADAMYLDGGLDCDRCGILGADGEPTMWHGFVRQMNKQIHTVGSTLMKSQHVGVLALKGAATYVKGLYGIIEGEGYKELVSVSCRKAGVLVGCFDYEGKTALYVVNNDTKKCQDVTLHFDDVYHLEYMSSVCQGVKDTDNFKITFGAGTAMLIVVSKK